VILGSGGEIHRYEMASIASTCVLTFWMQVGTDFWTKGHADAEQDWQNASKMKVGMGAGSMDLMGETQRLFALAQQDENAFAAVE
jgi:hypothetical protein